MYTAISRCHTSEYENFTIVGQSRTEGHTFTQWPRLSIILCFVPFYILYKYFVLQKVTQLPKQELHAEFVSMPMERGMIILTTQIDRLFVNGQVKIRNSIRLGGHAHGIVTKIVLKTLPGGNGCRRIPFERQQVANT